MNPGKEAKTSAEPAATPARLSPRIEETIAGLALGLICLITLANVVVRYFTKASFAFTEEFSVFLMAVLTFVGAAAAFARGSHIRVDFFIRHLPAGQRFWLEQLTLLAGIVLFALVGWYAWRLFLDDWQYGTTSPGIGIAQWWYSIWLPVLAALIVLRIAGRMLRLRRGKA
jgi:TRAP-type C4-dicarboxylate transport system permease small subunit